MRVSAERLHRGFARNFPASRTCHKLAIDFGSGCVANNGAIISSMCNTEQEFDKCSHKQMPFCSAFAWERSNDFCLCLLRFFSIHLCRSINCTVV